jgi:hypothetical protein
MPLSGPWKSNSAGAWASTPECLQFGANRALSDLNPENVSPIAPGSASSHPSYSL